MVDWRFVGRNDELRTLQRLTMDGRTAAVIVAGPAGVGKSRLAQEHVLRMEKAGCPVIRARATGSAAGIPFGALTPLLPDGVGDAAVDRADLIRRTVLAVAERRAAGPVGRVVLFVDDVQLLDDASATLVHQLVGADAAFVVATMRTGEPLPDAITALWKDGSAERLDLGPLPDEDVTELLTAAVSGPVDPAAVASFIECCRGNALFLRELVLGALGSGALAEEGGLWRLRRGLMPSDRLIELVELRLGHLDPAERSLLELVSFGEPVGRAELEAFADLRLVESLERRSILVSRMSERRLEVRLAHPIYGEVVRAGTPPVRAQQVARSLAEVVEATGCRRREDVLRVATWRLLGGGARPETLLAGAAAARWRYDFELAERLARAAADSGAGFDAALLLAQLASLQGRRSEAEEALLVLAEQADDDRRRGQVAVVRFNNSAVWSGVDEKHIFDDAIADMTDPTWRDELEALHLHPLLNRDGPRAAAAAAEPLLARTEGPALGFTCLVGGYSLARLGKARQALEVSERGTAAQEGQRDPSSAWYWWWQFFVRSATLTWVGRLAEAREVAADQYRQALAAHSVEAQATFALVSTFGVGESGDVHRALAAIREATSLHLELDRPLMLRYCYIYGALASALAGRVKDAERAVADLDALQLSMLLQQEVDVIQARAWTAVAAGNLPEGRQHLRDAAALGADVGDRVGEATALHGLARLGRAHEAHRRLATVARDMEGDLVVGRVLHTEGLVGQDAEQLTEASRRFEALGAHLPAAEAAADAAVVLRRAGGRARRSAERRALLLAGRCEHVSTPSLGTIDGRARLTAAERDTALLASSGRSNREIAEELCLSVRTIENRLQRAYEKLGVSSRGELRAALDDSVEGLAVGGGAPADAGPSVSRPGRPRTVPSAPPPPGPRSGGSDGG